MRLFLFILFVPLIVTGQTTQEIVDKFIVASGGYSKWSEVKSIKKVVLVWQNLDFINLPDSQKSSIENTLPSRHNIIKMLPDFEIDKMTASDGSILTIYQNDKRSGMYTLGVFFENSSRKAFTSLALAANILILNNKRLLENAGETVFNGNPCFFLEGPYDPESNEQVRFIFNKQSGLLDAIENNNHGKKRITRFFDYFNIDGLIVPQRTESYSGDILFYKEITETIEFNPPLDKSVFYYKPEKINRNTDDTEGITINRSFDKDLRELIESNYSNERVFVDIWATWCAPCKIEFKKYDSLFYRTLSERNVNLVFISIDKSSAAKAWENDIYRYQLKGNHYLAGKKLLESLHQEVFKNGIVTIPRYLVVNESGKIISSDFVRPSDKNFSQELKKILEK
jgi:thiol-disulfide isomerase/thioredoxin